MCEKHTKLKKIHSQYVKRKRKRKYLYITAILRWTTKYHSLYRVEILNAWGEALAFYIGSTNLCKVLQVSYTLCNWSWSQCTIKCHQCARSIHTTTLEQEIKRKDIKLTLRTNRSSPLTPQDWPLYPHPTYFLNKLSLHNKLQTICLFGFSASVVLISMSFHAAFLLVG